MRNMYNKTMDIVSFLTQKEIHWEIVSSGQIFQSLILIPPMTQIQSKTFGTFLIGTMGDKVVFIHMGVKVGDESTIFKISGRSVVCAKSGLTHYLSNDLVVAKPEIMSIGDIYLYAGLLSG